MEQKKKFIEQVFGCSGILSGTLPDYEFRQQQLELSAEVDAALNSNEHLIAEAGTGVGKSFAYLVPAIRFSLQKKQTVVVSTNTINLQEQLLEKDMPFLFSSGIFPEKPGVVLLKGRGNYVCRRRVNASLTFQEELFDDDLARSLERIRKWSIRTADGTRSGLGFSVEPEVWEQVCSESHRCMGKKCEYFHNCFFQQKRREMSHAGIILVNHALLFSDISLRDNESSVLPDYNYLIMDEAHHLEDAATNHLGRSVNNYQLRKFLNTLVSQNNRRGFLVYRRVKNAGEMVDRCRRHADVFFGEIIQKCKDAQTFKIEPGAFGESPEHALDDLSQCLREMKEKFDDDESRVELNGFLNQAESFKNDLAAIIREQFPGYLSWAELHGIRQDSVTLKTVPVNVGPILQDKIFNDKSSVIMIGGTLAVNRSFRYFRSRTGVPDCREVLLGSPFDFRKQMKLEIPADLPHPRESEDEFSRAVAREVVRYLDISGGRAFVLFTSHRMLEDVYNIVVPHLKKKKITALKQDEATDRYQLLEEFKQDIDSVLFGTNSFWEGVDVMGPALSCVIITRLPFSVPDNPLTAARCREIKKQGKDPFREYSLPEAVLRLRQGIGRLIRHRNDRGMVVILDSRIVTQWYGRYFVSSI